MDEGPPPPVMELLQKWATEFATLIEAADADGIDVVIGLSVYDPLERRCSRWFNWTGCRPLLNDLVQRIMRELEQDASGATEPEE